MVPFVRIPASTPELISYALNAGAGGVVMPHVQNAKQAQELVRLARFPPMGDRSFPPAALIGERQSRVPPGRTVYEVWNGHAAVVCQIEDLMGVKNVQEICGVEGGACFCSFSPTFFNKEEKESLCSCDSRGLLQSDVLTLLPDYLQSTVSSSAPVTYACA